MMLEAQICDVWGEPVAGGTIINTSEGGGLSVREPVDDSRTASVTVSVFDDVARHIRPLDRVLSVTYGPFLVFKGQIVQATTDFAAATVTANAIDATFRLKHHYHRYEDAAVKGWFPVDGVGMRILIESAIPSEEQLDRGVPPLPILWGVDDTTRQPPRDEGGIWREPVERHANVWETLTNLSQLGIAPDFRFRPVDKDHYGTLGPPPTGYYCRLDTFDVLGEDKSDTVIFEHGTGQDTAENVLFEPDGDVVRNRFWVVAPGGQRNSGDDDRIAVSANHSSQNDYGLVEGLESSGQAKDRVTHEVLQEKARAMIQAYHRSPQFFTVTPRINHPGVPRYGYEYEVGDTIRARASRGTRDVDVVGRIMTATMSAVDQSGNSRVDLECVPSIVGDLDPGD